LGGFTLVIIQKPKINIAFQEAVLKAKKLNRPVLFSHVREIDKMDPLFFYHAGFPLYQGERFYWKDKGGETTIVGIGSSFIFRNDLKENRFEDIDQEWKRFIHEAVLDDGLSETATGPLIFGGFSFDPSQKKEVEWTDFSQATLQLPTFMLTVKSDKAYLTINILCSSHDEEDIIEKYIVEINELLNHSSFLITSQALKETMEIAPDQWKKTLDEVVGQLKMGEMEKVVLARKLKVSFEDSPHSDFILQNLLTQQPDSFTFSLEVLNSCFLGASPERLVKKTGEEIFSTCLAGSIGRGKTELEDTQLGQELLEDNKNRHEHHLVVEMIKSVLEKYCKDIDLPGHPTLMTVRDIQHLYTPIRGKIISSDTSILKFVEQLHPTPALGGVPREKAMESIKESENMDRGLYAGPIGWLDAKGNGEFAVAIRSGLINRNNSYLYAGCGVVADSNSESEYIETKIKFRPMLRAIGGHEDDI
jgi:menaquinone-specific isochorismate synthase